MLFITLLFFRYIKANGGIDTESSYPYTARDGRCKFKEADVGATDTGKGKATNIHRRFVMILEQLIEREYADVCHRCCAGLDKKQRSFLNHYIQVFVRRFIYQFIYSCNFWFKK